MANVMRTAKVPTILCTGFELHHGGFGGLVTPGVTVNAAGSSGSSGNTMRFDSFFKSFESCCGLEMCVWW